MKQTGHYCDGRFDENHMDFETFCGLSHTRKTALPLAVAMLGYIVMNALILGLLHIDSIMIGALLFLPFILLLIIGIWFKRQLLMLPFIIIMVSFFTRYTIYFVNKLAHILSVYLKANVYSYLKSLAH